MKLDFLEPYYRIRSSDFTKYAKFNASYIKGSLLSTKLPTYFGYETQDTEHTIIDNNNLVVLGRIPTVDDVENIKLAVKRKNKDKLLVVSAVDCFEFAIGGIVTLQELEKLEVAHLLIPIPDESAEISNLMLVDAILKIERYMQQDYALYVHCKAGMSRSATLVALIEKLQGNTKKLDDIFEDIKKIRTQCKKIPVQLVKANEVLPLIDQIEILKNINAKLAKLSPSLSLFPSLDYDDQLTESDKKILEQLSGRNYISTNFGKLLTEKERNLLTRMKNADNKIFSTEEATLLLSMNDPNYVQKKLHTSCDLNDYLSSVEFKTELTQLVSFKMLALEICKHERYLSTLIKSPSPVHEKLKAFFETIYTAKDANWYLDLLYTPYRCPFNLLIQERDAYQTFKNKFLQEVNQLLTRKFDVDVNELVSELELLRQEPPIARVYDEANNFVEMRQSKY